jgi:membrane-associated phospholipid phosphatase
MTIDPVPIKDNRVAYWIGRIFHPAVICIPTLALVLNDLPVGDAVLWTALVAGIVVTPGLITIAILKKRQRYVYQRQTRLPVYIVAWLSVFACLIGLLAVDGPVALRVCIAALVVWLPVQLLINTYYTKVSTHVAVVAGCFTGLLMLGRLDHVLLQTAGAAAIPLVAWARMTTKNHTLTQVVLGTVVGAGSVLVVFLVLLP